MNARLAQLETVRSVPIERIGFCACEGYARHAEFPDRFEAFSGIWGGRADAHAWFRFNVERPPIQDGQQAYLQIFTGIESGWDACNPQMLLFYDRKAVRGVDVNHTRFRLPAGVKEVTAYAYTGTDVTAPLSFRVDLQICDARIRAYRTKLEALYGILAYAPTGSALRDRLSSALRESVLALDLTRPHSQAFYASLTRADRILTEKTKADGGPTVWAVGHTHIDIAWLWTLAQTKEKVLRSFGTALALCDEYPEYRFMSSQPLLYRYVKQQDPDMYRRIKKKVASGQWEVEGAMWVEADCNLTSGESLIRQILVGKKFFREEFGKDSTILWLPDVFGYSAAMPQILAKTGVTKFVTSKISWNEYDRMPHEIFRWQGIDGTAVDAYFLTTQQKVKDQPGLQFVTYNGAGTSAEVEGTYFRLSDKELTSDVLMPYGYGDGGGGSTPEMIERLMFLSNGVDGCPKTKLGTVGEFFEKLDRNLEGKTQPVWAGELYLEFHRGTYTSMAKNKRNNRRAEFALWRAEWASVLAGVCAGVSYPQAQLEECLETVLTDQFHDILPGSSIDAVYDQTDEDYARVSETLETLQKKAFDALARRLPACKIAVFNPGCYCGGGTVVVDGVTMGLSDVPPKGYVCDPPLMALNTIRADLGGMENDFFRFSLDENGEIAALFDKRVSREVVAAGGVCNRIVAYEDLPYEFDNWEIKDYYREKPVALGRAENITVVDDGVRKGISYRRTFLSSTVWQTVWLYEHIARIDFETQVDWHEQHYLLRAEFDTGILADTATFDIQYGSVRRPAHENTSWDRAKFETCAHKYADVSEYGYGVALLNDCKYGHSACGGRLGLTLIKCGTYPNPRADLGRHVFTYALMPHVGDLCSAGVIGQAYLLNDPLLAVRPEDGGTLPHRYSLVEADCENVVVEVVKAAEDGKGIVVRVYECFGGRAHATIRTGFAFEKAFACDLLEENRTEIAAAGTTIRTAFTPYEIKTFYFAEKRS